ncbi:MAG: BNR-4 repeat-containing protein [Candidatus Symbiothrix sp.]|jgi:hypothetical protein|nr:BNR-4 repeat-containing protein [Candidatus Symbiothrix sp.]
MQKKLFFVFMTLWSFNFYSSAQTYEGKLISDEGAWCWFADPRALHYENAAGTINSSYIGYIDVHGNIKATQINYLTGTSCEVLIRSCFQPDDHDNPTFIVLPDERVMVFYSRHTDEACFYYRISQTAGDITTLGKEIKLVTSNNTTYPSPFILSNDPEHLYLCWRGINWHPTIGRLKISELDNDNIAFDWGPKQIVQSTGARPYAKYMSNGVDKIYLTYTTGHPDNENPNWVYFNYINITGTDATQITLSDVKGTTLSTINAGAHNVNKTTYATTYPDAVVNQDSYRNWVWQVSRDAAGNPVIAMVRINSAKTSHDYYHVKWNGSAWTTTFLANGGGHFHQSSGLELCYSGGMAIDDSHPNSIYCSVPVNGVYEIIKYTVGNPLTTDTITRNSIKNNVRPYIISKSENIADRLIWMHGDYYDWIVSSSYPKGYCTAIHADFSLPSESIKLDSLLVLHEDFSNETGGVLTVSNSTSKTIALTSSNEFSVSMTLKISSSAYSGTLLKIGNAITYSLTASSTKPAITLSGTNYSSTNILGSSDVWKTQSRSTSGTWYTPSKLDWFNLTITCKDGRLISYIDGRLDQNIAVGNTIALADLILGGFIGEIEDIYVYHRALNSAEIRQITGKIALQETLHKITDKIPTDVYSDLVLTKTGAAGENIVWTSSQPQIIATSGLVNLPTTPTPVTLTATVNGEIITIPVTVHPRTIAKNTVLYYPFTTEYTDAGQRYVADASGNGNDARVFGSAQIDGELNLKANTNAGFSANGYLLAPDGIVDKIRSYSVLVKITPDRLDNLPRIYDFGSGTGNSVFGRANGLAAGFKYNGATTILISPSQTLVSGQTTKLAFTFDAATHLTTIYINGEPVKSANTITNEPYQLSEIAATTRNYIGRTQWQSSTDVDFCGTMDDFYLFDIALTQTEIQTLQSETGNALNMPSAGYDKIQISNTMGKLIYTGKQTLEHSWTNQLKQSGVYIVRTVRNNELPITRKILFIK